MTARVLATCQLLSDHVVRGRSHQRLLPAIVLPCERYTATGIGRATVARPELEGIGNENRIRIPGVVRRGFARVVSHPRLRTIVRPSLFLERVLHVGGTDLHPADGGPGGGQIPRSIVVDLGGGDLPQPTLRSPGTLCRQFVAADGHGVSGSQPDDPLGNVIRAQGGQTGMRRRIFAFPRLGGGQGLSLDRPAGLCPTCQPRTTPST